MRPAFIPSATVGKVNSSSADRLPQLDPVHGVLEILDRASMTGTNKLGLLLTLLDLIPALESDSDSITKAELAERYFEIHWEHGRPYGPYGEIALRQSSVRKKRKDGTVADDTVVMQEVRKLRELLKNDLGHLQDKPLEVVKRGIQATERQSDWEKALEESLEKIERFLWKNPVALLQKLPGTPDQFLYEFESKASKLRLLPGVADTLIRFAAILRPLIEFRFAQAVMKLNRGELDSGVEDVYTHLFGKERFMPPPEMREQLVEIQRGRCILTGESLSVSGNSLDHVIPWSRARLSQIENFLVTTKSVNSMKSDSLLAPGLVKKWLRHVETNSDNIQKCAEGFRWPADFDSVRVVALHTYKALGPATGVWDGLVGVRPLGIEDRESVLKMLKH